MSIEIIWDLEEFHTIRLSFPSQWAWQELYEARDTVRLMAQSASGTVHMLYDMRGSQCPGGNGAPHLRNFFSNLPPQARDGLHAFVGASPDWKAHMTIFMRLHANLACDLIYVSGLEDGRVGIARKREQIDLLNEMEQDEVDVTRPSRQSVFGSLRERGNAPV